MTHPHQAPSDREESDMTLQMHGRLIGHARKCPAFWASGASTPQQTTSLRYTSSPGWSPCAFRKTTTVPGLGADEWNSTHMHATLVFPFRNCLLPHVCRTLPVGSCWLFSADTWPWDCPLMCLSPRRLRNDQARPEI